MNLVYYEAILSAGRLNRLFVKFLESSAVCFDIKGLKGVHLLLLYTIGPEEIFYQDLKKKSDLFVTNPHYSLKMLKSKGCLNFISCSDDKRLTSYRLTVTGLNIYRKLNDFLETKAVHLKQDIISLDDMKQWIRTLTQLESFLLNSTMRNKPSSAELTS